MFIERKQVSLNVSTKMMDRKILCHLISFSWWFPRSSLSSLRQQEESDRDHWREKGIENNLTLLSTYISFYRTLAELASRGWSNHRNLWRKWEKSHDWWKRQAEQLPITCHRFWEIATTTGCSVISMLLHSFWFLYVLQLLFRSG